MLEQKFGKPVDAKQAVSSFNKHAQDQNEERRRSQLMLQ